ncbi:MAG: preprotein translocase subunit SecE [Desulfobacteraceae bacterium]|nr:preprotein translocase subunit SecE [Desulfobacteraceae bacterium]MBC2758149.1 preprotein translocase subunit SecE [Desulfobacteraceae bacterium]
MARIQKKKTAPKTKKKQNSAVSDAVINKTDAGKPELSKKVAGVSVAPSEKKKKKTFAVKKSAGPDQSAVMKLADKYFGDWIQFFREVKVELTKVTWPSKKQTIGSTAVVIVFVFVIAFFLGMVDIGLSSLIRLIL